VSRTLRPAGVIARYVVLGAALGVPVGLLWVWWSPRVLVRSLADADFVDAYPQAFAVADLTLGALLLGAGLVIGIVAAVRLRRTGFTGGWAHVVGAIVAALTCAAVGRVVGWWIAGRAAVEQPDGTIALPVSVGANGILILGAFVALIVVVLVAAFSRDPVRNESERSGPS